MGMGSGVIFLPLRLQEIPSPSTAGCEPPPLSDAQNERLTDRDTTATHDVQIAPNWGGTACLSSLGMSHLVFTCTLRRTHLMEVDGMDP